MTSTPQSKALCSFTAAYGGAPLGENEVHVLRVSLDACALPTGEKLLSDDELARARALRFVADADEFIRARVALRRILANYLACPPPEVKFEFNARGKPAVAGLSFNLSHSGGLALIAVTRRGVIGIDVERVVDRPYAFYADWTYREAAVKAVGRGLFDPPVATPALNFVSLFCGPHYAATLAVENFDSHIRGFEFR